MELTFTSNIESSFGDDDYLSTLRQKKIKLRKRMSFLSRLSGRVAIWAEPWAWFHRRKQNRRSLDSVHIVTYCPGREEGNFLRRGVCGNALLVAPVLYKFSGRRIFIFWFLAAGWNYPRSPAHRPFLFCKRVEPSQLSTLALAYFSQISRCVCLWIV